MQPPDSFHSGLWTPWFDPWSLYLGLFRNRKRRDNTGDAEPNHVNPRIEGLNSYYLSPASAVITAIGYTAFEL